jgi:hypothetical protein
MSRLVRLDRIDASVSGAAIASSVRSKGRGSEGVRLLHRFSPRLAVLSEGPADDGAAGGAIDEAGLDTTELMIVRQ